jgi:hypothetical protein
LCLDERLLLDLLKRGERWQGELSPAAKKEENRGERTMAYWR